MFVKFPCYNISFSRLKAYRKNLFVKDINTLKYRPPCFNCFRTFAGALNKILFHWIEKQNHNNMHKQTLNKRKKKLL